MINISHLDHLVLTVANLARSIEFYTTVLGFKLVTFGENRKALVFGQQKINLHQKGDEVKPNAKVATCGSADLCFITTTDLNEVLNHLARHHIIPESSIVQRTGAVGTIHSIYLRDPDGNLLEISRY
ncbi:VOC family protein [Glaesserella sp.]|uniref:VOC family protein n=1 Tax=Glaesserella sp. TaxID=2094731 RepID=UPI0035A074BB